MAQVEQAPVDVCERVVDNAEVTQVEQAPVDVCEKVVDSAEGAQAPVDVCEKAVDSAEGTQVEQTPMDTSEKAAEVELAAEKEEASQAPADTSENSCAGAAQVEPIAKEAEEGATATCAEAEQVEQAPMDVSEKASTAGQVELGAEKEEASETPLDDVSEKVGTGAEEAQAEPTPDKEEPRAPVETGDAPEKQGQPQSEVLAGGEDAQDKDEAKSEPMAVDSTASVEEVTAQPQCEAETSGQDNPGNDLQATAAQVLEKENQEASDELKAAPDDKAMVVDTQVEAETPQLKSRKRAAPKTPCLEAMAAKIKRLREEADEAEAAIAGEVKKVEELQAKIAAMRSEADSKRAAAERASQEYSRKQCEASIAQLDSNVPKKPPNMFVMFRAELSKSLAGLSNRSELNKKIAEGWANLSAEEKQKYKDRHEELNKKYLEWGNSEEGRKNLRERAQLIRQCKATSAEELGKAISAIEPGEADEAMASPSAAKSARQTKETPAKEMPAKRRRVAPTTVASPTKEAPLDESVLEEASNADLVVQLRNLAARPDVQAMGKTSQELWDALRAHNGMVNAAKHALLSA